MEILLTIALNISSLIATYKNHIVATDKYIRCAMPKKTGASIFIEITKTMKLAAHTLANIHNAISVCTLLANTKDKTFIVSIAINPKSKCILPIVVSGVSEMVKSALNIPRPIYPNAIRPNRIPINILLFCIKLKASNMFAVAIAKNAIFIINPNLPMAYSLQV